MKQNLLILTDWYLPAYKAGGPIKSVSNIVNLLKEYFYIYILTSNRDKTDDLTTLDVKINTWIEQNDYSIMYLSSPNLRKRLKKEVTSLAPSVVYINSVFSFNFSIYPLYLKRFYLGTRSKWVLAPRGMLQIGAISLKKYKKFSFIKIAKMLGLYQGVYFHATDTIEKKDLVRLLKVEEDAIEVVSNIPSISKLVHINNKLKNSLRLVFIARISEKKNLALALNSLKNVNSIYYIQFHIYGPSESGYLDSLQSIMDELPQNVKVKYKGDLKFAEIDGVMTKYDVYILPTQGENFGHSIFEAFTNGLPVIISDQTPWRNLEEQGVGLDIPLDQPRKFTEAIDFFCQMDKVEYQQWSTSAKKYSKEFISKQDYTEAYVSLFSAKKRVGIIAPIPLHRYKGGISVFIEKILEQKGSFLKDNINIHFINTCKIPRSNKSTGKVSLKNIQNYFLFLKSAYYEIKRKNLRVIHLHSSIQNSLLKDSFTLWVFKKVFSLGTVIQIHFAEPKSIFHNTAGKFLTRYFLKNGADNILVLGSNIATMLEVEGIAKEKIKEVTYFHSPNNLNNIKTNDKMIKLLFVGSIDQRKGVFDLLQALHTVKNMNWTLSIAGEFTSKQYKKELLESKAYQHIKSKVHFVGYVSGSDKEELFQNSDVLVLPSYGEGLPVSILEGLFYNLAILTTNVGANSEHLSDIAKLIEPGDIHLLRSELINLISNKDYLNLRKSQASKLSKKFTFASFKKQLLPIYKNV